MKGKHLYWVQIDFSPYLCLVVNYTASLGDPANLSFFFSFLIYNITRSKVMRAACITRDNVACSQAAPRE